MFVVTDAPASCGDAVIARRRQTTLPLIKSGSALWQRGSAIRMFTAQVPCWRTACHATMNAVL
jgi:hypothetical protein